jgi:hypothetical protein
MRKSSNYSSKMLVQMTFKQFSNKASIWMIFP